MIKNIGKKKFKGASNIPFDAKNITKYYKDQKPHTGGSKFVDPLFPPTINSILAQDESGNFIDKVNGPKKSKDIEVGELTWTRIDDILKNSVVFEEKIHFDDIVQGNLGNCYFLSALSALTEMPYLIYQIFRTKEKNDQGFFEIVLYIDGEWQVVIIDDFFVTVKGTSPPELKFAKRNGRELWAIILEKAWAKVNGGYLNTVGVSLSRSYLLLLRLQLKKFGL